MYGKYSGISAAIHTLIIPLLLLQAGTARHIATVPEPQRKPHAMVAEFTLIGVTTVLLPNSRGLCLGCSIRK